MDAHLEEDPEPNRKNGKGEKACQNANGEVQIDTPVTGTGTFEPELIDKKVSGRRHGSADYRHCMSEAPYDDIRDHLMDL